MQLRLSILVSVALFCFMTFAIPIDTLQLYRRDYLDMLRRSQYIKAREAEYAYDLMARTEPDVKAVKSTHPSHPEVPLAEMHGYATGLRSVTEGKSTYTVEVKKN